MPLLMVNQKLELVLFRLHQENLTKEICYISKNVQLIEKQTILWLRNNWLPLLLII